MEMGATPVIAAAAFAMQLLGTVAIVVWKLTRIERNLYDALGRHRTEIDDRREHDLRNVGEAVGAIRTKMSEIEIWNRDNFARRDSVHTMSGRIEQLVVQSEERLTDQMTKMEQRLMAARP
jgi:hypothetical protein